MPQFRQNFITREWVIVAPERAKRPDQFKKDTGRKILPEHDEKCPFCTGNEHQTPEAVLEIVEKGKWTHRVVPNKFAAVNPDLSTKREYVGKYLSAPGFGIAEVVIESPLHNQTLATMPTGSIKTLLDIYKQRYTELAKNPSVDLITIFRNHGEKAGTSLEHPHSQIIATSIIAPQIRYPQARSLDYHDSNGDCPYCVMIREEIEQKERIVMGNKHFVVFCNFASRSPFEMHIMPKKHYARFDRINEEETIDLAEVLSKALKKLYYGLNNPDYNFVIFSAPVADGETHYDHWRLVIVPKLTTPAGFEIGSGIQINIMPPEQAAKFLAEVKVD